MATKTDPSLDVGALFQDDALIGGALERAVRRTIREHKEEGLPLAVWRQGKVVWVAAEELEAELSAEGEDPS